VAVRQQAQREKQFTSSAMSASECFQLSQEIDREKETIEKIEKIIVNWCPGMTLKSYGLGVDATPYGYRGSQYVSNPVQPGIFLL
jgi:hypothetical protein